MEEKEAQTVERLIGKSLEAFVLALEVYNRPSIRYRVEGFAFFICNAWELMLKAKIIRDRGMSAIYYRNNANRTLTLERCVAMLMTNDKDPVRRNLQDIIRLRNTSTHFIVEEHEQIYSGLFQSCVINFDQKMHDYHNVNTSDSIPPHFLMVSMTASPATPETIRAKYPPEIAERFLFDESEIEQEQMIQANQKYAACIETTLAVVKNPKKADFTVSYDSDSDKSMRVAKEFRDPHTTHPLSAKMIVEHVNRKLERDGIVLLARGEPKRFTKNDWTLFFKFYGLKGDSQYAYAHQIGNTVQYTYSMRTVDFIMGKIRESPGTVIDDLKKALKGREEARQTPGAKDSKP